jgi:serine/threonine protein kinase
MADSTFILPEKSEGTPVEQWVDLVCDMYIEKLDKGDPVFPLEVLKSVEAEYHVPLMQALIDCEVARPQYAGILPLTWDGVRADALLGPLLLLILNNREHLERYHILGMVGRGSFGIVWKARDRILDRYIAIKRVQGHKDLIDRVFEEARFLASLHHPFVLQVLHAVRWDDQHIWIISPLMENGTLDDLCEKQPLSPDAALQLVTEIVDALQYLHSKGLYHRDIKPANILIDADGHAVLADFGLAISANNRHMGSGSGTLHYQAPEQIEGSAKVIDGRADLWGVGVVLYKLLSRGLPFFATSNDELKRQITHASPRPMEESGQIVPRRLQAVCLKLLQKNPDDRFQSARELHRALKREIQLRTLQSHWKRFAISMALFATLGFYSVFSLLSRPNGEQTVALGGTPQLNSLRLYIDRGRAGEPVDTSHLEPLTIVANGRKVSLDYRSESFKPLTESDQFYLSGEFDRPTESIVLLIDAHGIPEIVGLSDGRDVTVSMNTDHDRAIRQARILASSPSGGNVLLVLTPTTSGASLSTKNVEQLLDLIAESTSPPPLEPRESRGAKSGGYVTSNPFDDYCSQIREALAGTYELHEAIHLRNQ